MLLISQAAFYIVTVLGLAYFFFRSRSFDFYTVGFASCVIYFLPGFFGFVRSSNNYALDEPILAETYAVFISVLLCVLLSAAVFDLAVGSKPVRRKRSITLSLTTESSIAVATVGLFATFLISGAVLFSPYKIEVLESIGRSYVLFQFATIYLVVFATIREQRAFLYVGIIFLIFDIYVGFRSSAVIALLAAMVIILSRKGHRSLAKKERLLLLLGICTVGIVFVYKQVYAIVKLGLWDALFERLTDKSTFFFALVKSEPFGTQSILNEVIRTNFHTGASHLVGVVNLLVPFSGFLGAETQSYNDLFQGYLFGDAVKGGMANNIWAQMYSIGGWLGLGIAIPAYAFLLGIGSWLLSIARGSVLCVVVVTFSFIAFYIHRNDIAFTLMLTRRCLMIWMILVLPGMLLGSVRRTMYGVSSG